MNALNEKTACMPSVGADAGQSINNLNESIPTGAGECKGNLRPPLQVVLIRGKHFDTVTMEELFDTVYDSTPPVIDGLLYITTLELFGSDNAVLSDSLAGTVGDDSGVAEDVVLQVGEHKRAERYAQT